MRSLKLICFIPLFVGTYFLHAQKTLQKKLKGKWEWVETSGGFAGEISTPKTENYTVQIEFSKNGLFKSFKNNVSDLKMKYKVSLGKSVYTIENVYLINYKSCKGPIVNRMNDSFEFKGNDTLILKEECMDCYSRVYVRKK